MVVPWQQGTKIGLVAAAEEDAAAAGIELREAIATLDREPFISTEAVTVIERVAEYCCCAQGLALSTLLRTGLSDALVHEVKAVEGTPEDGLPLGRWIPGQEIDPQLLDHYRRHGLVLERAWLEQPRTRVLRPAKEADDGLQGARKANQRAALERLWSLGEVETGAELAREAEVPESAVRLLVAKGYASYQEVEAPPPPLPSFAGEPLCAPRTTLPGGDACLSGALRRDRLAVIARRLKEDVDSGHSVLVLTPEHAVLTETANALASIVPVSVLSGELTDLQRRRTWEELKASGPVVLVATYMGLLAPLANLGRIVVLEAGSTSYKLSVGARLFAPTAARFLAEAHDVPLTASDVLEPPEQSRDLPPERKVRLESARARLHVSDLATARGWPIGAELTLVLRQVRQRDRQAILVAPRRGFSGALRCTDCRAHVMCPNCDLPLRYYRERRELRCHQCGHAAAPPSSCPSCDGLQLEPTKAAGTEWIAREVASLLPGMPVKRLDSDRRDDLGQLESGAPGIVVATTASFRRRPLPRVSLVAVTLFDAFVMDDFRAQEEALRLLLNLSELAPDSRPLTVIQTFQPNHPVLKVFRQGVTEAFLAELTDRRRRYGYPPYSELAKVQLTARKHDDAREIATWLAGAMATAGAGPKELLGPAPAPVMRTRNQFTYQLFVKARDGARLRSLLQPALNYRGKAKVRVDVDPRDLAGFID